MTDTEQAPAGLDLDRMVDNFDAFDHDTAQHLFEVTNHARSRCPVSHSSAYGGDLAGPPKPPGSPAPQASRDLLVQPGRGPSPPPRPSNTPRPPPSPPPTRH